MNYHTIRDAAELLDVPYGRVWYALATGKLQETTRIGKIRLFDDYAIAEMRSHFEKRRQPQGVDGSAA